MAIIRAWISVEGVAVDDEAIASTVLFDREKGKVRLGFPTRAVEADAIARGKKFIIERDFELSRVLLCTPSSTTSQLKDQSGISGYVIPRQEEKHCNSPAWVEFGNLPYVSSQPIQIVDKITSSGQIVIKDGGAVEVSRDLIGKTIRTQLSVFVDKRVSVSLEPLIGFDIHLIQQEQSKIKYLTVNVTTVVRSPAMGGTRWIEGVFDPPKIREELL